MIPLADLSARHRPPHALYGLMLFGVLLSAGNARAVLKVGENAPPLNLPTLTGESGVLKPQAGRATLVCFVKPSDRHTSTALAGCVDLLAREPALAARVNPYVVLLRRGDEAVPGVVKNMVAPWIVLVDKDEASFEAYRIVVTPTAVVFDEAGKVALEHPGYDPSLLQDLRLTLARVLKIELSAAARGEKAAAPNMNLGIARRLTKRQMWDEALKFYGDAAAKGPLPPEDQLNVAHIQLEIDRPDDALRTLDSITSQTELAGKISELRNKANALKQAHAARKAPPVH